MGKWMAFARELKEHSRKANWQLAWRELAAVTSGITGEDPRLQPVMVALVACGQAYLANDWAAFQLAADRVKALMKREAT